MQWISFKDLQPPLDKKILVIYKDRWSSEYILPAIAHESEMEQEQKKETINGNKKTIEITTVTSMEIFFTPDDPLCGCEYDWLDNERLTHWIELPKLPNEITDTVRV